MIRFAAGAAVILMLAVVTVPAVSPGVTERRADFQAIAAQLDPGGELFLVLHAGRWTDRLLTALAAGRDGLPAAEPGEQDVRAELELWRRFMNRQGISAFRGIGASSVARKGGQHDVKLFLLRDSADSNLPFWRGLFGWQPRRLLSLDFVPAGFSMVRAATLEPAALWQVLSEAVPSPPAQERVDAFQNVLKGWMGMDPAILFGSLRDELLVAVRFETDAVAALPSGDGERGPMPSFLVVAGTGEDILQGTVEALLGRLRIGLTETEVAGMRMRQAQEPLPGGSFRLQPAFASPPCFFVFGSSPAVVQEALLAYRHRNGLITRPAFQSAFQGVSMVNNGIFYSDDEAAQVVRHWRQSVVGMESETAGLESAPERMRLALTVFGMEAPACALVIHNRRNGVMLTGTSTIGGEVLLRRMGDAAWRLTDRWMRIPAGPLEEGM